MSSLIFKRGVSTGAQPAVVDGQILYHKDTSRFYLDTNGARIEINANDAKKLMGASLTDEILRYTNEQIPSSNLVRNELNKKISMEVEGEILKLYNKKVHQINAGEIGFDVEENMTWGDWCNSNYSKNSGLYWTDGQLRNMGTLNGYINAPWDGYIDINKDYSGSFSQCCFVSGTQVLISLENITKPIEDIREGDRVVSYNVETGENYYTTVKRLVLNKHSINMAKIFFDNGVTLEMTDYHPLYTIEGWHSLTDQNYNKLIIGDIVKTSSGWAKIIDIEQYQLNTPIVTYTLDVVNNDELLLDSDLNDNFYANGIVAHNAGEASCKT